MEKDIGKIPKNPETEIVIRIDDFGGRKGLTIREFVKSERYSGFTKAGTRIPAAQFKAFKEMVNSINEKDLEEVPSTTTPSTPSPTKPAPSDKKTRKKEDLEEVEF